MTNHLAATLKQDGIAILPDKIQPDQLAVLKRAFESRLAQRRWNTTDGFEQNEKWRRLVEDLFLVHPLFLQVALSEPVLDTLDDYFSGPHYQITEARGWETIKTQKQFHNWHNDAWYETKLEQVPPQIKLGVYLTDVESGYFSYARGSHRAQHRPGHWNDAQVAAIGTDIIDVKAPAGSMFLFDTSGIHRQSAPILAPRHALMFNYHMPDTPIQKSDRDYGRYHAVRLDAAGLASLSPRQQAVLTHRNTATAQPLAGNNPPMQKKRFPTIHKLIDAMLTTRLQIQVIADSIMRPVYGILRRLGLRA